MGVSILGQIVDILVGGLTSMAQGIGSGLNSMVTALFIETATVEGVTTYSLSAFGSVVAIFGGIALAVGLTTLVTKFIMSLGGRN